MLHISISVLPSVLILVVTLLFISLIIQIINTKNILNYITLSIYILINALIDILQQWFIPQKTTPQIALMH